MGESTRFSRALDDSKAVALTGKIMVVAIIVLFVVVVFVIFLHLYSKWFWRRLGEDEEEEEGTDSAPSRIRRSRRRRRFVFAPGQDPSAAAAALHQGLDSSVLRSLPALVFRAEDFSDGLECAVCLSELADGERARLLPKCNHGFHVDCIDMETPFPSDSPSCFGWFNFSGDSIGISKFLMRDIRYSAFHSVYLKSFPKKDSIYLANQYKVQKTKIQSRPTR